MLACEVCHILIADAIYDELPERQHKQLHEHLAKCATCRMQFSELQASVEQLQSIGLERQSFDDIPERTKLDSMWQNLEPALDKADAERYRKLPQWQWLNVVGSGIAVAASLILLLVYMPTSNNPLPDHATIAEQKSVDPEIMQYLNRAQVMLMQVANSSSSEAIDIPLGQTFARDMAIEANFLSTSENTAVKSGQKKLLKDIEFLLLQIANLDESNAAFGVQLLQRYLEDNNILFKIRLLEMRNQSPVI